MKDRFETWVLVFVIVLFGSMAYAIITTAQAYEPRVLRTATYERPDIPQCEKELWKRITTGC